jgi:DNA-binding winged helix-turn-helix (wHTH) protein/TolB-like protein
VNYCFGVFEFDAGSHELRKAGRLVAIEPQPARALALLLARANHLVTRDELKHAIWGPDTHVDFDRGLAYCISQIRGALGDAGDSPRFIQTIPKKGYRFIAPVQTPGSISPATPTDREGDRSDATQGGPSRRPGSRAWLAACAALLLLVGVAAAIALRRSGEAPARVVVAVSIFDNETGLAEYDRLVSGLSDLVVTRLTELAPDRLAVIGNAAVLRQPRNIRNLKAVAAGVRADYALLGQLQRSDSGLRFITHFIRLSDETHLRANRLSFPDRDVTGLEQQVVAEFERAVRQHVLTFGDVSR